MGPFGMQPGNDGEPEDVNESAEDAQMRAALEALLGEPFPQKPYALVPSGGENNPEFTDYVIHKDIDTENQCVFIFDSIVDAFAVAEEYKEATGREAEPVECDVYSLDEERFWVKFYRANGVVAILSLTDYKAHIGNADDRDDEDEGDPYDLRNLNR